MKEHLIDSWGPTQLSLLRQFLAQAEPGDKIIADINLVKDNGGEGWIHHCLRAASMGAPQGVTEKVKIEYAELNMPTLKPEL